MLLGLVLPGLLGSCGGSPGFDRWPVGWYFLGARIPVGGGGNHGLFSGRHHENLRRGLTDEYDDIKMGLT